MNLPEAAPPVGDLRLSCPKCHRAMGTAPIFYHATEVRYRTCRGCKQRWQVIIRPAEAILRGNAATSRLEWSPSKW